MEKEYLTVKEVMDQLQIARPTVYKYVKLGKLTVYHSGVGNRALFKVEDVAKLAEVKPAESPKESRLNPIEDQAA